MSKPTVSKEERASQLADLIKDVKKNITVYEVYEGFYQSRESGKNPNSDDIQLLGQVQRELKKSRELLAYITQFVKE